MIMKIEILQKVGFAVGKAQLLLFPACYVRFVSDSVAGLAICGDLFDNFRSGITEGIYARVSDPAKEFGRQFPIDIFKASEETLAMPDLCSFRIECSGRIFEGIPPEEIQIFLLAFGVELLKILLRKCACFLGGSIVKAQRAILAAVMPFLRQILRPFRLPSLSLLL